MATVLHTGPDRDIATRYLNQALELHSQAAIARHLGIDARTVRRWRVEQTVPAHYAFGLQGPSHEQRVAGAWAPSDTAARHGPAGADSALAGKRER